MHQSSDCMRVEAPAEKTAVVANPERGTRTLLDPVFTCRVFSADPDISAARRRLPLGDIWRAQDDQLLAGHVQLTFGSGQGFSGFRMLALFFLVIAVGEVPCKCGGFST